MDLFRARTDETIDEGGKNLSAKEMKERQRVLTLLIAGVFAFLSIQLFNLQVVKGEYYRTLSTQNHLRITPIPAPRGDILDRNGKCLVTSKPAFSVFYWYLDETKAKDTLPRLAAILGMDLSELEKKVAKYSGRYFEPIPIAKDITETQYVAIAEDIPNLPGVFIEPQPIRYYPEGELLSPVLGYVGEITESQLSSPRWKGYKMGDIVGQEGIESYYQDFLRGKDGGYQVEVDYRGRPTGNVGPGIEPEPGKSLLLELDLDLQKATEEALRRALEASPKAKGASAVVLDVHTGGVLAMASVPGFDPNKLVRGITQAELNEKLEKGQWRFANMAIAGLYPPGSAFKIVTAIAALAEGKTDPSERIFDPGYHPVAPSLVCHKRSGHGWVNIEEALGVSCNVYFYEMGRRLGVDAIAKYASALGLGEKTGIDLYGENYGTVPTTQWKQKAYSEGRVVQPEFLLAEHMMAAMGQVFHLDTPIQMASVVQAIANDGVRMKPRLVGAILDPEGNLVQEFKPEVRGTLEVAPQVLTSVKSGMLKVTSEKDGTAYWCFYDLPYQVAGKTGTAQNPLGEDHAWFVGFAPYDQPQIAFAVVVEQGGSGSVVAAPVGRAIVEAYVSPKAVQPENVSSEQ